MQGEHVGKPSNRNEDFREWDSPEKRDSRPTMLAMSGATASGAVVGFLLAGHIVMGAVAFAGVFVGVMLGWTARGIAQ